MKNDDIMKNKHVMIVDDDRNICQLMERNFSVQGCRPVSFNTFDEAVAHVQEKRVDVLITDLNLEDPDPAKDGIALLKRVKEINRSIMVIILTGFGTIDSAVEAMHHGAFHYATKPVNLDEINLIVARALEHQKLNQENSQLRRSLRKKYKFENFVGDSEPMQQVFRMIEKVADTDTTVLITGESGTGKELVAQAIHLHSHRSDRHLIPVNCAAIPSELLESEFFGHVKGAFTNAIRDKKGRFEQANGGTLFLDEVGDMPMPLQTKLLRAIQEGEIQPVGSDKTVKVDFRLIAATNKNLEKEVKAGRFREDLYYRLNVIPIYLPPLRERISDIPLLVNFFLARFNKEKKKHVQGVSREAMELLCAYEWPGNVRQLENLMERLVILNDSGTIDVEDIPLEYRKEDGHKLPLLRLPKEGLNLKAVVSEIEKNLIEQALAITNGNKNKAAALLQMNRTTLVEKIKRLF